MSIVLFVFLVLCLLSSLFFLFFFNDTATSEIYTLSLHDALPIYGDGRPLQAGSSPTPDRRIDGRPLRRSEEHTSELQSRENLVCRLLLEKKKKNTQISKKKSTIQEKTQSSESTAK